MEPYPSTRTPAIALFGAILVSMVLVSIVLVTPIQAQPGPLDVVRDSNEEILGLYAADDSGDDPEVSQQVFDVMDQVTSFSSIADAAIDGLCDAEAGDDCETFKNVFIELLRVSSVHKLGRYRADRFEYLGEDVDGDTAEVHTLAFYGEDEIEVDYFLSRIDDAWVIDNYVVDGVDTVRNYRKQFNRMLRNRSVEFVTERLRLRTEELRDES